MNREDLLKHANIAMDVAKQDLLKRGKVLPTLLMTFPDKPGIISPVPEEKIVPLILRRENPDAFTYTADVWIRDSKQQERRDAVQVVAATGPTRIISRMGFRRQDNTVIFDEVQVLTDEQFNQSVVDLGLHDDILGEILACGRLLLLEDGYFTSAGADTRFGYPKDGELEARRMTRSQMERELRGGGSWTLMVRYAYRAITTLPATLFNRSWKRVGKLKYDGEGKPRTFS